MQYIRQHCSYGDQAKTRGQNIPYCFEGNELQGSLNENHGAFALLVGEIRSHFTSARANLAPGRPRPLRFVSTLSPAFANPELTRWFTQEVLPHESALRNWLRHRFPRLHDWDDLIQESYLRLWRARAEGPIQSPKAYLFTTARNLALNRLGQIRQQDGLGEHDFSPVSIDEVSTPERVARHQELELLNQALQSLPDRCREVFTLRRLYGLSQKEIGAKLGISEKTVETQSFIAMKKCLHFFQQLDRPPVAVATVRGEVRSHHG